ncbi:MAG: flavodoxin family protein [Chloroflexi bacterium]|nr:flavodoxin family protein [Chloroflexota bacterium]
MKVLGICCSGRLHANTEILLQEALDSAQQNGAEVELVTLAGKHIIPCDGCWTCHELDRGCHVKDDIRDILEKMTEADGIIFGTPVYARSVTGQAKILLDRCTSLRRNGRSLLRGKVGAVVVTAGRVGLGQAAQVFNGFFGHTMTNAGSAMGFTSTMGEDKIKHRTPKDIIKQDIVAMKEARDLGRAVVRRIEEQALLRKIRAGEIKAT